jgi:hypothetical protein
MNEKVFEVDKDALKMALKVIFLGTSYINSVKRKNSVRRKITILMG